MDHGRLKFMKVFVTMPTKCPNPLYRQNKKCHASSTVLVYTQLYVYIGITHQVPCVFREG